MMRAHSHVGITVRDLDESIYFYHDVLGLEIVTEPSPWLEGPELEAGMAIPGASFRMVCLLAPGIMVELFEYRSPPSETTQLLSPQSFGASHVGFAVDDIRQRKAELERKGVRFLTDVNEVEEGMYAGWRYVYFVDPDGYRLELLEIAPEAPDHGAAIARYLENRPPRAQQTMPA